MSHESAVVLWVLDTCCWVALVVTTSPVVDMADPTDALEVDGTSRCTST